MKWLKVHKTFRGGRSKDHFIEVVDNCSSDEQGDIAREWAEESEGGHNYGWTVYWKVVNFPPIEWLEKEIEWMQHKSTAHWNAFTHLRKEVENYRSLLKKLKDLQQKYRQEIPRIP